MDGTARFKQTLPLPSAWTSTSPLVNGTTRQVDTIASGMGGSAAEWNRPYLCWKICHVNASIVLVDICNAWYAGCFSFSRWRGAYELGTSGGPRKVSVPRLGKIWDGERPGLSMHRRGRGLMYRCRGMVQQVAGHHAKQNSINNYRFCCRPSDSWTAVALCVDVNRHCKHFSSNII
jgi:hypothetical protein